MIVRMRVRIAIAADVAYPKLQAVAFAGLADRVKIFYFALAILAKFSCGLL